MSYGGMAILAVFFHGLEARATEKTSCSPIFGNPPRWANYLIAFPVDSAIIRGLPSA